MQRQVTGYGKLRVRDSELSLPGTDKKDDYDCFNALKDLKVRDLVEGEETVVSSDEVVSQKRGSTG